MMWIAARARGQSGLQGHSTDVNRRKSMSKSRKGGVAWGFHCQRADRGGSVDSEAMAFGSWHVINFFPDRNFVPFFFRQWLFSFANMGK